MYTTAHTWITHCSARLGPPQSLAYSLMNPQAKYYLSAALTEAQRWGQSLEGTKGDPRNGGRK